MGEYLRSFSSQRPGAQTVAPSPSVTPSRSLSPPTQTIALSPSGTPPPNASFPWANLNGTFMHAEDCVMHLRSGVFGINLAILACSLYFNTASPSSRPHLCAATNGTNSSNVNQLSLNDTCYLRCQGECDDYGDGTCSCMNGFKLVGLWTCIGELV